MILFNPVFLALVSLGNYFPAPTSHTILAAEHVLKFLALGLYFSMLLFFVVIIFIFQFVFSVHDEWFRSNILPFKGNQLSTWLSFVCSFDLVLTKSFCLIRHILHHFLLYLSQCSYFM